MPLMTVEFSGSWPWSPLIVPSVTSGLASTCRRVPATTDVLLAWLSTA